MPRDYFANTVERCAEFAVTGNWGKLVRPRSLKVRLPVILKLVKIHGESASQSELLSYRSADWKLQERRA